MSLAQNGLPVRTVITEHDQATVISATLAIPAINFPLVIEPPPASQTISLARLRKLERQARKHIRYQATERYMHAKARPEDLERGNLAFATSSPTASSAE